MNIFNRMSIFKRIFAKPPQYTAKIAKERLQIIVSHQRAELTRKDFLPALQKELIDVIAKYIPIDRDQVKVELERVGDRSTLELNVTFPEIKMVVTESADA